MRSSHLESLGKPYSLHDAQAVTDWLDKAFDGSWSFKIVTHEIRDAEVIVLGELSAAGTVRQHFGRARTARPAGGDKHLGEDLKKAAQDALAECTCGLSLKARGKNGSNRSKTVSLKQQNGFKDIKPLTSQQLSAIFSLAKFRGLDQSEVLALTRERFSKDPGELDYLQASQIISDLVIQPEEGPATPPGEKEGPAAPSGKKG